MSSTERNPFSFQQRAIINPTPNGYGSVSFVRTWFRVDELSPETVNPKSGDVCFSVNARARKIYTGAQCANSTSSIVFPLMDISRCVWCYLRVLRFLDLLETRLALFENRETEPLQVYSSLRWTFVCLFDALRWLALYRSRGNGYGETVAVKFDGGNTAIHTVTLSFILRWCIRIWLSECSSRWLDGGCSYKFICLWTQLKWNQSKSLFFS